jgi:hypothetical protein
MMQEQWLIRIYSGDNGIILLIFDAGKTVNNVIEMSYAIVCRVNNTSKAHI